MENETRCGAFFRLAELHDFGPEGGSLLVAVSGRDFPVSGCEI